MPSAPTLSSGEADHCLADCVHYWIVKIVDRADISGECGHVGSQSATFH